MQKKILYIVLGVILVAALGGGYLFLTMKEIPVLIVNKSAGEIIFEEDIKMKKEFDTKGFVQTKEELIGKEVTLAIESNTPVVPFSVKEFEQNGLSQQPPGEVIVEDENNVIISIKLTGEQAPGQIKKGDNVYILTHYPGTAVPGQQAFSIVYPTIAKIESTSTSLGPDGVSTVLTGVNLLIDRNYSTSVLFGNIEGQTYLIQTTDEKPVNFEGITAQKEFEKFFTLMPKISDNDIVYEPEKESVETAPTATPESDKEKEVE